MFGVCFKGDKYVFRAAADAEMFSRDAFLRWLSVDWRFFSAPFGIFMNILIEKNATATGNRCHHRSTMQKSPPTSM